MYKKLLFGLFLLGGLFLIWPVSDSVYPALMYKGWARELNVKNEPQTKAAELPPVINWAEKIGESLELLEKSEPLKYETRNKKSAGELVRKQITLAILDRRAAKVFEYRVWVREQEIKDYKKTGIINLEPDLPRAVFVKEIIRGSTSNSSLSDLRIVVNWWNSFNTDYGFPEDPNLVVIANKYLLPSSQLGTLPERSKGGYTEIIYVPYSGGIHVPELIEAGKKYMEENISIAFGQLENARVESRFIKSRMVTEGISKDFIKNIILVEHVDPDAFRIADDGGKMLVERVLVIIGANKEKAFRYTGSPAGASGLAQFIHSTYQNIISKYPQAKMLKDYTLGMANHVNAIKAMILFFDEHKKALASKITRKDITKPLGITEEMLAAAYNGGPARVSRSINKFGLVWIGSQFRLPSSQRILRLETLNYVENFRSIKNLSIF